MGIILHIDGAFPKIVFVYLNMCSMFVLIYVFPFSYWTLELGMADCIF